MDDTRKLLLETKVKALGALSSDTLVQLLDTDTVEQALQVLAEHRILSAPVIAPGDDGQGRWPAQLPNSDIMGFICVNDILTSFLEYYTREVAHDVVPGHVLSHAENVGDVVQNGNPRTSSTGAACTTSGVGAGSRAHSLSGAAVSMLGRMRQLEEVGRRFAKLQIRQLSCKGRDGDFLHSRHAGEATLLELVMYGFLDPKRRGMHEGEEQSCVVHRVALFDNTGAITTVISQSDIVRFLAAHMERMGPLAGATMAQLGWDRKPVLSCIPETPALEAMQLMMTEGVSCLAVVAGSHTGAAGGVGGAAGRLLGNFSASEMRTMTAEHFGALSLPVGEFLALENETEYVAANRERLLEEGVVGSPAYSFTLNRLRRCRPHAPGEEVGQQLIVATSDSTFQEVVELLVRHRIHRVYVVGPGEVPVGIVTCTDVLRKVVELATLAAPPSPGGRVVPRRS